jgi:DNA-binding response OmpR family regulator
LPNITGSKLPSTNQSQVRSAYSVGLKVFIGRLRAKLEPKDSSPCIETERGLGQRFVRPPAER